VREAVTRIRDFWDDTYAKAVGTYVGFLVDKHADHNSGFQRWHNGNQQMTNTFSRQALQMMWDYCEANPFSHSTGSAIGSLDDILACPPLKYPIAASDIAKVVQGTATAISIEDNKVAAVITDPPYYDSVPYGDLSDFFYVWMKRALGALYPELFRTPLTPKQQELIAYYGSGERKIQKTPEWYEKGMNNAFSEIHRILDQNGIACVMFAHKTTTAWEAIIAALLSSGLTVTASWPLHTEMKTRMVAQNAAALASSVTLVCRKRQENAGNGYWDDVRQELKQVVQENLDFFWSQGIRGADFFISAIGPALSVLGKYERVTNYALTKILRTTHTVAIDPESRFYIVWQWSYGDAQVPADESFKLSQALGMHTEEMWDRTGVLEKSGENVQAVPIIKRMRVKNLGEPTADGAPASLIDVLHRMCAFREKGDTQGMAQFLGQSGDANNPTLWLVAQAISEILPDGDKEKQLMQGLLNQREGLEEATRQRTLF
jgi:putative DNA methylase